MPELTADELESLLVSLSDYSEDAVRAAIEAAREADKAAQLLEVLREEYDEEVLDDFRAIAIAVAMGEARVTGALDALLHAATRDDVDMGIFGEAAGYAIQRMGPTGYDALMRFIERPALPWEHVRAYQYLQGAAAADPETRARVADFCAARAARELRVAYDDEWNPGTAVLQTLADLGDPRAGPLLEAAIRESPHESDRESYHYLQEKFRRGEPQDREFDWTADWPAVCAEWAKALADNDDDYVSDLDEENAAAAREDRRLADEFGASGFARTLGTDWWSPAEAADEIAYWFDFGRQYVPIDALRLDTHAVREVMYGWLPRKMTAEAGYFEAFPLLLEAFVRFLHATGRLPEPAPLLALAAEARTKLPRLAADPSNWGMAKSFFMAGKASGFDMRTPEGLDAWTAAYNASLPAAREPALPEPEDASSGPYAPVTKPFRRETKKVGRNDPCPCGSGKKYKKCCGG